MRVLYLFANAKQTFLKGLCIDSCCIMLVLAVEVVLEGVLSMLSDASEVEVEEGMLMCSMIPMQAARLPASTITDSNREYDSEEKEERRERGGEKVKERIRVGRGENRRRDRRGLGEIVERNKERGRSMIGKRSRGRTER